MSRVPDIDEAELTPEQRRIYDAIVAGPRGRVPGPLKVWLHSPDLAHHAQALGAFCRYGTSLPPCLSELAIIITSAFWRAGYEWHVHAPIAIEAGVDPAVVEAIRTGATPQFARSDEAALYAFVRELLETRAVNGAIFARAVEALGHQGVVELVGILGYYGLISMTIKAFDVAVPEGEPDPFAHG